MTDEPELAGLKKSAGNDSMAAFRHRSGEQFNFTPDAGNSQREAEIRLLELEATIERMKSEIWDIKTGRLKTEIAAITERVSGLPTKSLLITLTLARLPCLRFSFVS